MEAVFWYARLAAGACHVDNSVRTATTTVVNVSLFLFMFGMKPTQQRRFDKVMRMHDWTAQ